MVLLDFPDSAMIIKAASCRDLKFRPDQMPPLFFS
jgi:hypothetical protein